MAKTPDVIAQDMLTKLKITAPGLSFELGTPERKLLDAAAEAISEAYVDQYLVGSLLDIESKSGLELEQWTAIFGYGRLQGRKAAGVVRVEVTTASQDDLTIPEGTLFYTRQGLPGSGGKLYFTSTQAAVVPAGSFVVDVLVECTAVGTVGNVPPDSIVYLGSILGATKVTNLTAMTGGVDVETDDELRQRFKDTFMRNIAGTRDWYIGLAYQNKNVSKATVFGPITKCVTQTTVPASNTTLTSSTAGLLHNDIKHVWEGEGHVSVYKNLGQADEVFYRMGPQSDFTWQGGGVPILTRTIDSTMTVGEVVDLEFEYTSYCSRNDPVRGITNKVDVFVDGVDPCTVTERTRITNAGKLVNSSASPFHVGKFVRVGSNQVAPTPNNLFTRLGSVPVLSFPSNVSVVATDNDGSGHPVVITYTEGTDYHLLRGTTLLAGSVREVAGIEWVSGPPVGTQLTLSYVYNRVPEVLGAVIKQSKQITTDVLVHQAEYVFLKTYLSVEYDRGHSVPQVENAIQDRLRSYFASLPFGYWIEISDLCLAVHQVLGVDNVWVTTAAEHSTNYGIRAYGDSTATAAIDGGPLTADFKLNDNQLPVFLSAVILRKANR